MRTLVLLTAFCTSLFVVSLWATGRELAPFLENQTTREQRLDQTVVQPPTVTLSHAGQTRMLRDCVELLSSYYGRAQPTNLRSKAILNCRTAADEVTRSSPVDGFAWYVVALASAMSADFDSFSSAVVRSQELTPSEQWIAAQRVATTEEYFAKASPAARLSEQKDMAVMIASRDGVTNMAARYATSPDFRNRITDAVESMSERNQSRFVVTLREVIAARKNRGAIAR